MKTFTFTKTMAWDAEFIRDMFNDQFGTSFTLEDIERNWDAIVCYIDKTMDNCLGQFLWEDFPQLANDWDVDLFDN